MEKEEFNKLNVMDQIGYINQDLENKSLTEICTKLKISRSTIRERFLKHGYLYNKNQNKYLYSEGDNKAQEGNEFKNNTNVLEDKIKALESKMEALEDKINNNSLHQINIKKFEGKTVSRCYRLYEDVQKEFSKFCKENSNLKVQDILSMALYEYMENSKKNIKSREG